MENWTRSCRGSRYTSVRIEIQLSKSNSAHAQRRWRVQSKTASYRFLYAVIGRWYALSAGSRTTSF